MTRRAAVLDALEPAAVASLSRATFAKLGIKPGDMVRVTTRRGEVELDSRQDDATPDGVVFFQQVGNPSPLTPIAALNGVSSGSKANVRTQRVMSALSPKADICSAARHVR